MTRNASLRLALATVAMVMINRIASADPRSDVQSAFVRCNVFADDRTWLNCIYGAVQPVRSKLGLPPAPDSQLNLVPSASSLMPQSSSSPPSMGTQKINKRVGIGSFLFGGQSIVTNAQMEAYSIDQNGLFTITLTNGQVWREVEGSPMPQWHDPASRLLVSISAGAFNSYNLIVAGEGIGYKAKRIR